MMHRGLRFPLCPADRSLGRAVLLILLAIYTATFNGLPAGPDGEVSFQTTSALWRQQSFALSGTPEAEALIEHADASEPGGFSVQRVVRDGEARYYGWFGIGQALGALPFYGAGKAMAQFAPSLATAHEGHLRYGASRSEYFEHLFVGWRNPLLTALTAMLIVFAARRFGLAPRTAFVAGLGYGLATFAWPQARANLSDVQATFLLTSALYAMLLEREEGGRRGAFIFGLSMGGAFLTRVALAPAVVVLDIAFVSGLFRAHRRAADSIARQPIRVSLGLALLPQVVALGCWLLTNQMRFGSALDSGYGLALAGGLFGGDPIGALWGVTLSPGKGLIWMAPGVLLAVIGFRRARREGEALLLTTFVGLLAAVFLPALLMGGWHGAYTYGPRYILPALPALWLLAAIGFERSDVDARVRRVAHGLLAFGLMIQIPAALVDTMTYHELAVVAAQEHFEAPAALEEPSDIAAFRFAAMQFDWGYAAPWAHWRILRHRVSQPGETFEVREIFRHDSESLLTPAQMRERGFQHLAWVDLQERLGGSIWPAVIFICLLLAGGVVATARGLDAS